MLTWVYFREIPFQIPCMTQATEAGMLRWFFSRCISHRLDAKPYTFPSVKHQQFGIQSWSIYAFMQKYPITIKRKFRIV